MNTHHPHRPHGDRVGISHVLLDIEGTTCPVSFVAGTLFPYASAQLGSYLKDHAQDPKVQGVLNAVLRSWKEDSSAEARALLNACGNPDAVVAEQLQGLEDYLQLLIRCDRKLTALKDLQGMIWRQGYTNGDLRPPLFEDVPEALRRWSAEGKVLGVYSSGSVAAQQLLYGHSNAGDLRSLFSHWFDTRIGAKTETKSYTSMAEAMNCSCRAVLFISDSPAELRAASDAGMTVYFSDRAGNPERDSGGYPSISNFADLNVA